MSGESILHLIDANVLVDANRDYYRMDQVPEFWAWLQHMGESNRIKIPREIYKELESGTDDIPQWLRRKDVRDALRLEERHLEARVQEVMLRGYAQDLSEDELEEMGQDPFLISYALDNPRRCIVTAEVSKPSKKRGNRKIPDVCDTLGVSWCAKYELTKRLGFRTDWKSRISR